jgi:exoribonuclease-2
MIKENSLAVYKNRPALVKEKSQDKITIALSDGTQIKVREKDIEIIHPGPVKNFNGIEETGVAAHVAAPHVAATNGSVREAWELLLAEQEKPVSLKELAELAYNDYNPVSAWAAYRLIVDGLLFTGTVNAVLPRQKDQVEADEKKREEKQKASGEREQFLQRLKNRQPYLAPENPGDPPPQSPVPSPQSPSSPPDDRRFIQDVEALAFGKSAKSRTMKDIGLGETPEEAHALLLECGFWTEKTNPHPARCGVSLLPAKHIPDPPPPENRRDLTGMAAFAIDSPWSHDPDDAVSLEIEGGKQNLYVHVADPAASVGADSPVEREGRDRGATLYIPEGTFRMIAEEALPVFALGLAETSPALTFKMTLNGDGEIEGTEIFPSTVKVSRLTYEEADRFISGANGSRTDGSMLCDLHALAERNFRRRAASGAVTIDLPETHISMNGDRVTIEPVVPYRSADMVRECMLLAGEGAGIWAARHSLPVPFVGQETGEAPGEILPGLAGSFQLRRCMRPRTLSVHPYRHEGLGLETYVQVTSPLRRYTDLLAHIQIRALLQGSGALKSGPLSADEVSARMGAGEAATAAVVQAERASRNHWTMVYLSEKKESGTGPEFWDAVVLEKRGNRHVVTIPELALETQVSIRRNIAPNDPLKLVLKSVHIPRGEAVFAAEE